ncbi:hypothetical protein FACS189423_11830 [Bacteroidia bacterium]|nr:hypothetical protein FACS189423_11830 [Bacteroidia bacterium]
MTSLTLSNSITEIKSNTFIGCSGLSSIIIPNSVTRIGRRAFDGCYKLASIFIPNSVASIDNYAFGYCDALKKVEVQWNTPLVVPSGLFGEIGFIRIDFSAATLIVPAGTKALYEAADVWKNFGTIEEKTIVIEEGEPAGANGTGKINLSLSIPADVPFEGSFSIEFPAGLNLNETNTILSLSLSGAYELTFTQTGERKWSFTITSSSLRSAQEAAYRSIMDIVYTIDETVEDGSYNVNLTDLEFVFEDGTVISADEITVNVTVDHEYTGIHQPNQTQATLSIQDGNLHINSPVSEKIAVYSVSGILVYANEKQSGEANFNIKYVQDKVLIVKGSSGWVRKVVK